MRVVGRLSLGVTSLVLSLVAVEIAYRALQGLPILSRANWRMRRIEARRLESPSIQDSRLGWTMRPWVGTTGFNTLDLGVRSNGLHEPGVRIGGVLTVGDSFTAGSEVVDDDSWPAQLEQILGEPVINAGIGGYGTDQIIMRAEQLLPILRPRALVVGFLEGDIDRSAFSVYGQPKPYYTLEKGRLTFHRPGDLQIRGARSAWDAVHRTFVNALGHFAIADQLLANLIPQQWFFTGNEGYVRVETDAVEVTCALLERLGRETKASGVRSLLFMQYGAWVYARHEPRSKAAVRVLACAERSGFDVVDEFETLQSVYTHDRGVLSSYYVMHDGGKTYGHMSSRGNRYAARLVATAIAARRPGDDAEVQHRTAAYPLLPRTEVPAFENVLARVASSEHALIQASKDAGGRTTDYQVVARGNAGEHYVVGSLGSPPARHTLVSELSSGTTDHVRLQLLDGQGHVAIADVDLRLAEARASPAQTLESATVARRLDDGWVRVSVSADLPGPGRTVILQILTSDGRTGFEAKGQSIHVRALHIDRTQGGS